MYEDNNHMTPESGAGPDGEQQPSNLQGGAQDGGMRQDNLFYGSTGGNAGNGMDPRERSNPNGGYYTAAAEYLETSIQTAVTGRRAANIQAAAMGRRAGDIQTAVMEAVRMGITVCRIRILTFLTMRTENQRNRAIIRRSVLYRWCLGLFLCFFFVPALGYCLPL